MFDALRRGVALIAITAMSALSTANLATQAPASSPEKSKANEAQAQVVQSAGVEADAIQSTATYDVAEVVQSATQSQSSPGSFPSKYGLPEQRALSGNATTASVEIPAIIVKDPAPDIRVSNAFQSKHLNC